MLQLVGDHLWQSTVCVGVAWLLTLALRKNHASIRFWVWFAASMKFLVPFAALVALGAALPWRPAPLPAAAPVAIAEVVSQPFSARLAAGPPTTPTAAPRLVDLALVAVPYLWGAGTLVVLGVWFVRWRRLAYAVRSATPVSDGPEFDVLGKLAVIRGMIPPVLRTATSGMEPAIVGVRRPVLLWPASISQRLTPPQMEAILAHELVHVARRDNLLAILHMTVEALFWYHPLVWVIGSCLVCEREHACDEEVVRTSGRRDAYAEGILRTCEHCVESSLRCASGVTGADLKARVAAIMRGTTRRLGPVRIALVAAVAAALVSIPVLAGMLSRTPPNETAPQVTDRRGERAFDVASIRLNRSSTQEGGLQPLSPGGRLDATAVTAKSLMRIAYGAPVALMPEQVVGGPDWFAQERFDLSARSSLTLDFEASREMLRTLLRDRFGLQFRRDTRQRPILALALARSASTGPGLRPSTSTCTPAGRGAGPNQWSTLCGVKVLNPGELRAERVTLGFLAGVLSGLPSMHLLVRDHTGLAGDFDVDLKWDPSPTGAEDDPELPTALREQLGLRLVPSMGPVDYLVVSRAVRPSVDGTAQGDALAHATTAISGTTSPAASSEVAAAPTSQTPAEPLASIKPSLPDTPNRVRMLPGGRLEATGVYVRQLITVAFEIQTVLLAETPAWTKKEHFDISAKFGETSEDVRKAGAAMLAMLRDLLRTRFRLEMHKETRDMPVYLLTRVRSDGRLGEHLKPSTRDCTVTNVFGDGGARPCGVFGGGWGQMMGDGVDLPVITKMFSSLVDRPVLDRTGLSGTLDLDLTYDSDKFPPERRDATRPDFFTAIREQLGLELKAGTAPIEVTVVDRVERPTEN